MSAPFLYMCLRATLLRVCCPLVLVCCLYAVCVRARACVCVLQGFRCVEGNPVPIPCSTGHYCPPSGAETPCEPGKYNPVPAATSVAACIACPPGALCTATGIGNFSDYPCPGVWE